MKTLVIHPKDNTTVFLEKIYSSIENKTVLTGKISKAEVKDMIKEHDRVIMLGHGTPGGLLSMKQFITDNGYIIDSSMVEVLSEGKNNVFIWCNANQFVTDYSLSGFYSGMFISELREAYYCGVFGAHNKDVKISNNVFSEIVSKHINKETDFLFEGVRKDYKIVANNNPVAQYNHKRLYKN